MLSLIRILYRFIMEAITGKLLRRRLMMLHEPRPLFVPLQQKLSVFLLMMLRLLLALLTLLLLFMRFVVMRHLMLAALEGLVHKDLREALLQELLHPTRVEEMI
jgi:hypothetical protein